MATFTAYIVEKDSENRVTNRFGELDRESLPPGDVLVRVRYSSLNYKDALATTGHPGVVRKFPHVPGIDAAGIVEESSAASFKPGDEVIVTSFDLGAGQWGGWGEFIRVPASWVVPLPKSLSLMQAMIFGTAGFTAAMSLELLQTNGITPASGPILVTGATGGVGCLAVGILSRAGYEVVASTGKADAHDFLRGLGAAKIVDRAAVSDAGPKPMLSAQWAGAIDTVGSHTLNTIVRSLMPFGCVAACGLVGGTDLSLTIFPFLMRGVILAGIDSAHYPAERRPQLWDKLAGEWRPPKLDEVSELVPLADIQPKIDAIFRGAIRGRTVVEVGPVAAKG